MDEFVLDASVPDQRIDHSPTGTPVDPDIAVDDPHDITLGLSVCPTHVSHFRVGSEPRVCSIALEFRILLFNQYMGIETWVVLDELL